MESNGELRAKYVFADDYEPDYITGAFGSIQPNGDLVIHFYAERIPIPYETVQSISENGMPGEEISIVKPDPSQFKLRRSIKNGAVMNKDTALGVYRWLKGQLKQMGVKEDEL